MSIFTFYYFTLLRFNKTGLTSRMETEIDVTMVSFDGVNIFELVGLYLLDKLSNFIGRENVGL